MQQQAQNTSSNLGNIIEQLNEEPDVQMPSPVPQPHPQSEIRVQRKGPTIDYNKQRLEKLISDSHKRRTRYQRGLDIAINGASLSSQGYQDLNNKDIPFVSGANSQQINGEESKREDQHISDIGQSYSTFDLPSSRSKMSKDQTSNYTQNISSTRKGPVNYLEKNKKLLETPQANKTKESQVINSSGNSSAIQNARFWHQHLRTDKVSPAPANPFIQARPSITATGDKLVRPRVNTNLRTTSAVGKISRFTKSPDQRARDSQPSVQLGMSPQDRLNEDLQKRITEELKSEIKDSINSKYSQIEVMLQQNIAAVSNGHANQIEEIQIQEIPQTDRHGEKPPTTKRPGVIVTNPLLPKKTQQKPFQLSTANRGSRRNDSKSSIASVSSIKTQPVTVGNRNFHPTIPTQTIELVPKSEKKVTSQAKNPVIAPKNRFTSAKRDPVSQAINRAQSKSSATSQIHNQVNKLATRSTGGRNNQIGTHATQPNHYVDSAQPDFDRDDMTNSEAPTPARDAPQKTKTKLFIPRKRKLSSTNNNNPYDKNNPLFGSDSLGSQINFADSMGLTNDFTELNAKQNDTLSQIEDQPSNINTSKSANQPPKPRESSINNINLRSKEDVMNLNIEDIWTEMEAIKRSKNVAQGLYQAFQDQFNDQSSQLFDAQQVSPTRRLISMKNTVAKHQVIEYRQGIQGRYAIQYTTCPEKSYVILPAEGETDYDKIKDKNAHKLVDKIIAGQVEKIEIEERGKPKKSNPMERKVNKRTPVAITSSNVQRAELLGGLQLNGATQAINSSEGERKQVSFQDNDNDEYQGEISSHSSFVDSQSKPDIEDNNNQEEAILEVDENGQPAVEDESVDEGQIINICSGRDSEGRQSIIVIEEKLNSQNSQRLESMVPVPTSQVPIPISQEQQIANSQADGQTEAVPFFSDEQPIHVENNSIISATHKEAVEIFDSNNQQIADAFQIQPQMDNSPDFQNEDDIAIVQASKDDVNGINQESALETVPEEVNEEQKTYQNEESKQEEVPVQTNHPENEEEDGQSPEQQNDQAASENTARSSNNKKKNRKRKNKKR